MGNALSQSFFIPAPTLTEKNLPDQTGKVHIVTGGYTGCGQELAKILYQHNATVYVAGRTKEKGQHAINAMKAKFPNSTGKLEFLLLDLGDLTTIKPAAEEFISKETRLDTLTNNAGVMMPPVGSKTTQGQELQMGTNCMGPYLFTEQLLPVLKSTAASSPSGSVRVTFAASLAINFSPKGGVVFDASTGAPKVHDSSTNYAQSKAGNLLLAAEFAKRYGKDGILFLSWNPGNLRSELQRHMPWWQNLLLKPILYDAVYGGYTELYAACSGDITESHNGAFVAPWGRIYDYKNDLVAATKEEAEGGFGVGKKFFDWCAKETSKYV